MQNYVMSAENSTSARARRERLAHFTDDDRRELFATLAVQVRNSAQRAARSSTGVPRQTRKVESARSDTSCSSSSVRVGKPPGPLRVLGFTTAYVLSTTSMTVGRVSQTAARLTDQRSQLSEGDRQHGDVGVRHGARRGEGIDRALRGYATPLEPPCEPLLELHVTRVRLH